VRPLRVALFVNLGQPPFTNNLLGLVTAFQRAAGVTVVEPHRFPGFRSTGGAAPAPIPRAAVERAAASGPFDVVVCAAGGLYVLREHRDLLGTEAVWVGLALSDPLGLVAGLTIGREFDLYYTQDPQCVSAYRDRGIRAKRCDLAVDPWVFPKVPRDEQWDVVFVGKWTPLRDRLVAALARRFRVLVHTHRGENRWSVPARPPLDDPAGLMRALASARLALEVATVEGGPERFRGTRRLTPRPQIAALAATPSLIEPFPHLPEFFTPGRDIAIYRGPGELVRRARELLADPQGRRRMAAAARERVLREQTWDQRVSAILADVADHRRATDPTPENGSAHPPP